MKTLKVKKMVLNSYFQRNKANHILEYMVGWRKSLYFEKKRRWKKRGVSDSRLDVFKRGGGHSDAYCVQQGGWGGGSKNQEKMRTPM